MSADIKIRFVVATRATEEEFYTSTGMGKFLKLYKFPNIELDIYPQNSEGLPKLYNQSIEKARDNPAILIFVHDDILITDFYWAANIWNGLQHFQIIGLAGSKRRLPGQPSWTFINDNFQYEEDQYLSGVVAHGSTFPPENLSIYGNSCQEVKLLDGLLLASLSQTLLGNDLYFDERFDFHFYDMDFCRTAELKKIRMGTWPLSVVHESVGNLQSDGWVSGLKKYREKWGD